MLRRWWKRPPTFTATPTSPVAVAPAAPDLQALRDVYLNLFDVQRSHALIDVAINGTDAHYQSIILDVDPLRGSVAIDELFPAGFVGLPGQPVTVTVRLDGARKLTFNTHILVRSETQGLETYTLALPESLDYNQRRGAFRLQLGQGWGVITEFVAPDQQRCSARVRDLSSTGIRLELPDSAALAAGDQLNDLQFEFGGRNFRCGADVRNVLEQKQLGDHVVVGAAFRDMPRIEQRSLERMIMQLQREQVQQAII
jgi:c-di-GMP-binding flagellar brake protein YcgR